jgi:hypothetical protein
LGERLKCGTAERMRPERNELATLFAVATLYCYPSVSARDCRSRQKTIKRTIYTRNEIPKAHAMINQSNRLFISLGTNHSYKKNMGISSQGKWIAHLAYGHDGCHGYKSEIAQTIIISTNTMASVIGESSKGCEHVQSDNRIY